MCFALETNLELDNQKKNNQRTFSVWLAVSLELRSFPYQTNLYSTESYKGVLCSG